MFSSLASLSPFLVNYMTSVCRWIDHFVRHSSWHVKWNNRCLHTFPKCHQFNQPWWKQLIWCIRMINSSITLANPLQYWYNCRAWENERSRMLLFSTLRCWVCIENCQCPIMVSSAENEGHAMKWQPASCCKQAALIATRPTVVDWIISLRPT